LAGGVRAAVVGRGGSATASSEVTRVLATQKAEEFMALEITNVVSIRFLAIPFIDITAHSRHIQQGIGLVPAKDSALRMPVAAPNKEMATKRNTALIPRS